LPKSATEAKQGLDIDTEKEGNAPGPPREIKKARGPRTTVEATAEKDATETTRAPKKAGTKPQAKDAASTTETVQVTTAKTVVRAENDDSMTEVLGPALVAGALGRKVGDARTEMTIKGITECRVKIMSMRQKAKRPVPKAPDNSMEGDDPRELVEATDVRLSLLATNQHVQLELPGDMTDENKRATRSCGIKETGVVKRTSETGNDTPHNGQKD